MKKSFKEILLMKSKTLAAVYFLGDELVVLNDNKPFALNFNL